MLLFTSIYLLSLFLGTHCITCSCLSFCVCACDKRKLCVNPKQTLVRVLSGYITANRPFWARQFEVFQPFTSIVYVMVRILISVNSLNRSTKLWPIERHILWINYICRLSVENPIHWKTSLRDLYNKGDTGLVALLIGEWKKNDCKLIFYTSVHSFTNMESAVLSSFEVHSATHNATI